MCFVCVCVCVFLEQLTSVRQANGDNRPRLTRKQREIVQHNPSLVSLPWTVNARSCVYLHQCLDLNKNLSVTINVTASKSRIIISFHYHSQQPVLFLVNISFRLSSMRGIMYGPKIHFHHGLNAGHFWTFNSQLITIKY